jgi:hypothetical protein
MSQIHEMNNLIDFQTLFLYNIIEIYFKPIIMFNMFLFIFFVSDYVHHLSIAFNKSKSPVLICFSYSQCFF